MKQVTRAAPTKETGPHLKNESIDRLLPSVRQRAAKHHAIQKADGRAKENVPLQAKKAHS